MRTARDPLISFLSIRKTDKHDYMHSLILAELLKILYKQYPHINYDHLCGTIPKDKSISLNRKGINYDIAFRTPTHIIHIEIKTTKR
jgi:hypothetical protein